MTQILSRYVHVEYVMGTAVTFDIRAENRWIVDRCERRKRQPAVHRRHAGFAMGAAGPEWTLDLEGYEAMTILADDTVLTTPGFPALAA